MKEGKLRSTLLGQHLQGHTIQWEARSQEPEGGGLGPSPLTITEGIGSDSGGLNWRHNPVSQPPCGGASFKVSTSHPRAHSTETRKFHSLAQAGGSIQAFWTLRATLSWNANLFPFLPIPQPLTPPHINKAHKTPGGHTAGFCLVVLKLWTSTSQTSQGHSVLSHRW